MKLNTSHSLPNIDPASHRAEALYIVFHPIGLESLCRRRQWNVPLCQPLCSFEVTKNLHSVLWKLASKLVVVDRARLGCRLPAFSVNVVLLGHQIRLSRPSQKLSRQLRSVLILTKFSAANSGLPDTPRGLAQSYFWNTRTRLPRVPELHYLRCSFAHCLLSALSPATSALDSLEVAVIKIASPFARLADGAKSSESVRHVHLSS